MARFESELFEPATWKTAYPWEPINHLDRFDALWAAKIIARFREQHVRAAVQSAQYSSAEATEYVTRMLVERQRKIVRYWFTKLSPPDDFAVQDGQLCFADLSVVHRRLVGTPTMKVVARQYQGDGRPRGAALQPTSSDARKCLELLTTHGYAIVRIRTKFSERDWHAVDLHIDMSLDRWLRFIGIERL
ncbi:MAG: hypothetical protein GY811_24385 [Myxococcales bacterium]|nr:hypothetical protein [Myxococcales bacterium]